MRAGERHSREPGAIGAAGARFPVGDSNRAAGGARELLSPGAHRAPRCGGARAHPGEFDWMRSWSRRARLRRRLRRTRRYGRGWNGLRRPSDLIPQTRCAGGRWVYVTRPSGGGRRRSFSCSSPGARCSGSAARSAAARARLRTIRRRSVHRRRHGVRTGGQRNAAPPRRSSATTVTSDSGVEVRLGARQRTERTSAPSAPSASSAPPASGDAAGTRARGRVGTAYSGAGLRRHDSGAAEHVRADVESRLGDARGRVYQAPIKSAVGACPTSEGCTDLQARLRALVSPPGGWRGRRALSPSREGTARCMTRKDR